MKQAVIVSEQAYEDPDETVAVVGPFDGLEAAAAALREAGWVPVDWEREPWAWESPLRSLLSAEIRPLADRVPAARP